MTTGEHLAGLAFFTLTIGAAIAAAMLLERRMAPAMRGAPRAVAVSVLATAAVLVAHLVPAALTILSRESALAAALLLAACAWLVPQRGDGATGEPPVAELAPGPVDRTLGVLAIAIGLVWLALVAWRELPLTADGFDAASAYLPTAARWLQEGSIWGLADWVPNFFYGASPGNGSVIVLSALLPWENDFVARYAIYPFVVLMAGALYALGRELRAPWPAAALVALAVTAAPVVVQPALNDALLDPVLYSTLAAGMLFLVRHHRTGRGFELALAGVALGIAFGTKFYGFTAVPIVLGVWLVARLVAGVAGREALRDGAIAAGLVALFGGVWVLRNAIETGNPIFPVGLEVGGLSIFSAPTDPMRELVGSTLVDYLGSPGVWTDELRSQFRVATGIGLLGLAAASLGALAMLIARLRRRPIDARDGIALALLATAALLSVSYFLTPYSALGPEGEPILAAANVRYGIPAMIAAAGAAAYLAGRLGRLGLTAFEVIALFAFVDALRIGVTAPRSVLYASIVLAIVITLAVLAYPALAARTRLPSSAPSPRAGAAAAVGLALVVLAVAGDRWQTTYNAGRYITGDPALNHLIVEAPEGSHIGLAGTWDAQGVAPIYPAFGPRLRNRVEYVGDYEDHLMEPHLDRASFVADLESRRPDLLVIGRAESPVEAQRDAELPPGQRERGWARDAGYDEVVVSDRLIVMGREG